MLHSSKYKLVPPKPVQKTLQQKKAEKHFAGVVITPHVIVIAAELNSFSIHTTVVQRTSASTCISRFRRFLCIDEVVYELIDVANASGSLDAREGLHNAHGSCNPAMGARGLSVRSLQPHCVSRAFARLRLFITVDLLLVRAGGC
eukprot:6465461-Amphidinium_carterae.2